MVERFVRDEEAAGSNPVTSTIIYGIHESECRFFIFFCIKPNCMYNFLRIQFGFLVKRKIFNIRQFSPMSFA